MTRKFVYFINPVSGTGKKRGLAELIRKKTAEQHIPFEILPTDPGGNYNNLKKKIQVEGITDIIVCGGDGTVNRLACALQGADINIGIIPVGSGNGLALAAGIPVKTAKALEVIFKGNTVYIDSFSINGIFSCMLSGLGFDAQVAHDFALQKKRGLLRYIKLSLKHFFYAKPFPFGLSVDGKEFNTEAFFVSIANSNQYGNNFTIAPRASMQDGLLDIIVVNKMSKLRMLWTVLMQIRYGQVRLYEDKKYHRTGIHYFQASALRIRNPGIAPLHIDGDPGTSAPVYDIGIIEKAFRLIIP